MTPERASLLESTFFRPTAGCCDPSNLNSVSFLFLSRAIENLGRSFGSGSCQKNHEPRDQEVPGQPFSSVRGLRRPSRRRSPVDPGLEPERPFRSRLEFRRFRCRSDFRWNLSAKSVTSSMKMSGLKKFISKQEDKNRSLEEGFKTCGREKLRS